MRRLLLPLLILLIASIGVQAQEQNTELALEIVANINDWRIDEGVWPLKTNPTLEAMALDQATYLASLGSLPGDLHEGRRGLQPRQRALVAPFNWPHYELEAQIAIGENAGIGSVRSAMNFWRGSDLHTRTALNRGYREIGVAAVPRGSDHIFIVVFGSRPNVLPALADPREPGAIFLSNEEFLYARFFDSIQTASEIRLFDADGRPLTDGSVDWAETITIPESIGETVFILSSDGDHEILSAVNVGVDSAILPGFIPSADDPVQVVAAPTATTVPTTQPTPTTAPAEPTTEPTATPAEAEPSATPEPTEEPEATPVPVADPDIRIVYEGNTLDVVNISGAAADWQGLEIVGVARTFPFSQFSRVADFPLGAFPARHCLQIRSTSVSGGVVLPDDCGWVRSLVTLLPERLFWTLGDFEIRLNGSPLATCPANEGTCEFALP